MKSGHFIIAYLARIENLKKSQLEKWTSKVQFLDLHLVGMFWVKNKLGFKFE